MMNNNQKINYDDEIDLKNLLSIIWAGKIYIILFSILSVFFTSLYLQSAERKYSIEYNLNPVSETISTPNIRGFSGLAAITGVQLPSSTNKDFNIFKALITSPEISKFIFENKKIIRDIFRSEWDERINNFSRPPKSKIQILLSDTKKLLTGNKEINYMPPNPRRLAIFIDENIQISEDKETGFLRLTSETSRPELILSLIISAAEVTDKVMRQRYIDFSIEPLSFYKEKLRTARSREHKEALAGLIGIEEQKLMLASRGKYFIAEPYINPKISLYPTTPRPMLTLAIAIMLGFVIGIAVVFIRHAIKKEN